MLGNRASRHVKGLGEFADGRLALQETLKDRAARRVCERVERKTEPVISPCRTDRLRNHVVQYLSGRLSVNGDIAFGGNPGFEHRHGQDRGQDSYGRARQEGDAGGARVGVLRRF